MLVFFMDLINFNLFDFLKTRIIFFVFSID